MLICEEKKATNFIYLFNSRNKSRPSSPRDMWQSNANKGERGLLPALGRSATTKGIRRPPQCAVRKTRGQEYPHTIGQRKEERKASEQQFSPPHTLPVPSWFPTQSTHPSLQHEQLLRPSHQPSSAQPQTAQENGQTASPTWDWLTTPGHLPGFSLPTPPTSPLPAWGSGSVEGHATESF